MLRIKGVQDFSKSIASGVISGKILKKTLPKKGDTSQKKEDIQKQKIISYLPSKDEYHIGGYNYNGAGTKVDERLSLNYKGKVGSKSYFLPVNKLDLTAFQHDLFYYAHDDVTRAYADNLYLSKFKSDKSSTHIKFLSNMVINGIWATRLVKIPAGSYITGAITKEKTINFLKGLRRILTTPPKKGMGSVGGYLFNPKAGKAPQALKDLFKTHLGITGTSKGDSTKYREILKYKILPSAFMYGTGIISKPIEDVKQFLFLLWSYVQESTEWKGLESENIKVVDKYKDYLKIVGKFNENDDFIINDDINSKTASKKYKEFFKEYTKYLKYVNVKYESYSDFKPIKIPKLNNSNIEMVSEPSMLKPPELTISQDIKEKISNFFDPINLQTKTPTEFDKEIVEVFSDINNIRITTSPSVEPSKKITTSEPTITDIEEEIEDETKGANGADEPRYFDLDFLKQNNPEEDNIRYFDLDFISK